MPTTITPIPAPVLTRYGSTLEARYAKCTLSARPATLDDGSQGWRCWMSVSGTDTSFIFDESFGVDFTARSSKHDHRKPQERILAGFKDVWREYLAHSFVYSAYRHSYPCSPDYPRGWPDPDDFVLDWTARR